MTDETEVDYRRADSEAKAFATIRDHLGIASDAPVAQEVLSTKSLTPIPIPIDLNQLNQMIKRNGGLLEMTVTNKEGKVLDIAWLYGLITF